MTEYKHTIVISLFPRLPGKFGFRSSFLSRNSVKCLVFRHSVVRIFSEISVRIRLFPQVHEFPLFSQSLKGTVLQFLLPLFPGHSSMVFFGKMIEDRECIGLGASGFCNVDCCFSTLMHFIAENATCTSNLE